MNAHDDATRSTEETVFSLHAAVSTQTVRFGTNRKYVGPPDQFGSDFEWGPNDTRYHAGTITIPRPLQQVTLTQRTAAAEATQSKVDLAQEPRKVIRDFLDDASHQGRIAYAGSRQSLVFIHGYAFKFIEIADVEAAIVSNYGSPNNLFFSWPSYGNHFKYPEDRTHAYGSGAAAGQFLRDLLDEVAAAEIPPRLSLICHSMGNRVMSSIAQALKDPKYLKPYFEHILLFAADEDYAAFNDPGKLRPVLQMYKHSLNIYTNGNDGALAAGQLANGFTPELGQYGPYSFPLQDDYGAAITSAFWLNCTGVADSIGGTLGHQYFRLSPEAMADARHVLEGLPPAAIPGRERDNDYGGQRYTIKAS
ncbi:alpha/beta hydrolase [Methylobacterium sp. NFXW15]|uniref:alpha/beta hydrolase n=1 Tax=Methylobacterium sp. NFXW15 TaxID=2819512 RepID=UPI003CEAE6E5